MSHIFDSPETFAADSIRGLVDLHPDLRAIPGGVIRASAPDSPTVAVVIGGGAGHYPAFSGYVGHGLAEAAVVGDVFASPSTSDIVRIATLANSGAGVLLGFGNYAGDALNFNAAADRLRDTGVPTRTIAVTDDVASARPDKRHERRGVAGDVAVFKVAGAAASLGADLDTVTELAARANSRAYSLGVAFTGCTLPGRAEALFALPHGSMGVGMGIHGEPGIREVPVVGARELAQILVDGVLIEAPTSPKRVAVILNGLGSTKQEELFLLWAHVSVALKDRGLTLVAPLVGEFVTSLEMAGCSLTVLVLDDELERLWLADCSSPALTRGDTAINRREFRELSALDSSTGEWSEASSESRHASLAFSAGLNAVAEVIEREEANLGRLDAVAGDGDHGQGMRRGAKAAAVAAYRAAHGGAGLATTVTSAADAWADRAGGTSGALWGVVLRGWASAFDDESAPTGLEIVDGARRALAALKSTGGAEVGDKTMVDAFEPFVLSLEKDAVPGEAFSGTWLRAADTSTAAAGATSRLRPLKGRARPLAERSIGHPDAGAVSLALCMTAFGSVLDAITRDEGV